MNFNIFKYAPVAASVAIMSLSSCVNDLDVTPIDPSTKMNPDEAALYTKCYANMGLAGQGGANGDCDVAGLDGGTTGFVRQLFNAQELTTDHAICAWGDTGIPAFNFGTWDASHPMLQGFYYRLYAGINFCNHYLTEFKDTEKDEEKERRYAEVRFLRALYYYYLMDCFGNPPFTTELSSGAAPKQIKRADLFKWIETELMDCKDVMLPSANRKNGEVGYGRADQDAANLLLARMYLNAEVYTGTANWADAKTYAEKVIKGEHKLFKGGTNGWSSYQMLFMGDNGENGASVEAVLPILQDGATTTSWGTTLFLMASTWKDDMQTTLGEFKLETNPDTNKKEYKLTDYYGTTEYWAGNRARKQLLDKFFPNEDAPAVTMAEMVEAAGDDRALFVGLGVSIDSKKKDQLKTKERTLHVDKPTEFTSGYSVGKFTNGYSTKQPGHHSQYVDADFFLMRSAEAYLIYAEAEARTNGMQTKVNEDGTRYMNDIRSRAGLSGDALKDKYSLDEILDEWSREFYYEGLRRTNLVRHGKFTSGKYLWDWKGGAENGVAIDETRNIFAIPAEDKNANPNLEQNKGYN